MEILGWHEDGVSARSVFVTVLAGIWAAALYITWLGVSDYRALSDSEIANATVVRIDESIRQGPDTAHLRFATSDGRTINATVVHDGTALGDEVTIRYSVSNPTVVQLVTKDRIDELLSSAWLLAAPLVATVWYFRRLRSSTPP